MYHKVFHGNCVQWGSKTFYPHFELETTVVLVPKSFREHRKPGKFLHVGINREFQKFRKSLVNIESFQLESF